MQVKIFMDTGTGGVKKVENEINRWLLENHDKITIVDSQTALCTVGESGGESVQCLAVTVWFAEP